MIKTTKKLLKKNELAFLIVNQIKTFYFKRISDEKLLRKRFKKRLDRELNLISPTKYNDKLQWLKLYWHDPLATTCADKHLVREYVRNTVGSKYLNEIYGVYDSPEEIDYKSLPSSFVLKGTHGSGFNIICENKEKLKWKDAQKSMNRWLSTNYYWRNREWVYKNIQAKIICEKFLDIGEDIEMRDYRVFCFNGKAKFIAVDLNINNKSKARRNLYTLDWKLKKEEIYYHKDSKINLPKPRALEEIIEVAEKLSEPFPHARIDFYIIKDRPIFSEITFFHQSGMGDIRPSEFEDKMGEWLELPENNNNQRW